MDNYKAEALIKYYNDLKDKLKKELEEYQKGNQAKVNDLSFILKDAQEICTHPKVKITTDYNYHRNEEWEEHHCEVCGKRIKRI